MNGSRLARALLLLLCYRRLTCVSCAAITREFAEAPPTRGDSVPVHSQRLEDSDPMYIIGDLSSTFQELDRSTDAHRHFYGQNMGGRIAENFAEKSSLADHKILGALEIDSGEETVLKRKSQAMKLQSQMENTERVNREKGIPELKKHTQEIKRPNGKKHVDYNKGIYNIKNLQTGSTIASEEMTNTTDDGAHTTVKTSSTTTPRSTSTSTFEAYCSEACEQGVGGPECSCPNHPIG